MKVTQLTALEILDSRGRPTIQVGCELKSGARGSAQVPSGASTGKAEAWELRDGDPQRYDGRGCRQAVERVLGPIQSAIGGRDFESQQQLDEALIALDGTPNKSHLGANAVLGVSIAFARATAAEQGLPLYRHFSAIAGLSDRPLRLPQLTVNLFSGGKHAGAQVPIQDVLLVPPSTSTIADGLANICAVYQAAAGLAGQQYGMRLLTADEGGLAPPFPSVDAMFGDAIAAIRAAGLTPGEDMSLAIDVASSHFFQEGRYCLSDAKLNSSQMIERIVQWARAHHIVSVEDGLAEDEWEEWPKLCAALQPHAITVGDDLLCTNPSRIRRAIDAAACDTLLLKVNQIGTLSEAAQALQLAREANWQVTISARSGETEDDWLADLAVGWGADQIKVGSVTQSERLAKYNRLLAVEEELSRELRVES